VKLRRLGGSRRLPVSGDPYEKSSLLIIALVSALFTLATCKAANAGDDGPDDTDTVAPVTGTSISFSDIGGSSATVSWGAATDATTAQVGLQYKLVRASQDTDIDTIAEADAISGANLVMGWTANTITKSVAGLSISTTYYFAALVKDAEGLMSLYAPQEVTTLATVDTTPPVVGTAISFASTTATGTTVNWGAASDNITAPVNLQYKLVKSSASSSIDTVAEADAISGADLVMDWTANTISKDAASLTASTSYWFAVLAKDTAGNMSLYAPQTVTTSAADDTTPPTVGTAISFSSTTSTGTTVNWGAANDNVTAQPNLQYKVVKASSSSAIDTVAEVKAIMTAGQGLVMDWTANTITRAVAGLTDSTTYYFAVIVRDDAMNMSLYSPQSVTTTDATAPTVGTGISFANTTATGTTVNWGAANDTVTAQASLQYKVVRASYSSAIDTVSEANAIMTAGSGLVMDWTANTTTRAVAGLTDSTTYYFAVIVRDDAMNMSLYSPQSVTTTDATAPTVGTGISFANTTATGTTVNWGAANDTVTAQASLQYKVVRASYSSAIDTVSEANAIMTAGQGLVMDWTANTTTSAVTGLTGNTTYYFAVHVKDAAGNTSLYNPQSVTTLVAVPSPITQYRFENNGNDSIGSKNLIWMGTASYSTTKKEGDYSVNLNGSTNYLHNDSTSISVPSGMTVTAWVYASTAADCPAAITVYNGAYRYSFGLANPVGTGADLGIFDDMTNPACDVAINSGTWYHIAFTVDTSKNVLMYVNGSVIPDNDSSSPNVVNAYISTITRVDIGTDGGMYNWAGYIDDVRIYNSVLSAAQVATLYASY